MGWRHPAARHGQQRRGYSCRTSERSHHVVVGRVTFEVQGDEKLGLRRSRLFSKRRRRSRLCYGPSEAALRLLRWSYLSQCWLLASQSADDMALIRVAGFGYTEQAMSRWTNSLNSISIFDKIRPRKSYFTSLLNLIFRNNSENACLVIHFLTNQMQIKFNSIKKIEIRFCKFLVNTGP